MHTQPTFCMQLYMPSQSHQVGGLTILFNNYCSLDISFKGALKNLEEFTDKNFRPFYTEL